MSVRLVSVVTTRMVLPQTNLQLYQCLVKGDASAAELGQVRAAYDAAQTLFCDCVRPSHKPFLCHLVGTAGALALWQRDLPVVIAGLLHSAYLFGQFGDGDRGPSGRRRRWLRSIVGSDVENLVWRYSTLRWDQPIAAVRRLALADATYRDLVAVKFADEFEELSDGSPKYSLKKSYVFGMGAGNNGTTGSWTRLPRRFMTMPPDNFVQPVSGIRNWTFPNRCGRKTSVFT